MFFDKISFRLETRNFDPEKLKTLRGNKDKDINYIQNGRYIQLNVFDVPISFYESFFDIYMEIMIRLAFQGFLIGNLRLKVINFIASNFNNFNMNSLWEKVLYYSIFNDFSETFNLSGFELTTDFRDYIPYKIPESTQLIDRGTNYSPEYKAIYRPNGQKKGYVYSFFKEYDKAKKEGWNYTTRRIELNVYQKHTRHFHKVHLFCPTAEALKILKPSLIKSLRDTLTTNDILFDMEWIRKNEPFLFQLLSGARFRQKYWGDKSA